MYKVKLARTKSGSTAIQRIQYKERSLYILSVPKMILNLNK